MKNKFLYPILLAVLLSFSISCSEIGSSSDSDRPVINVIEEGISSYYAGDTIRYKITLSDVSNELASFTISTSVSGDSTTGIITIEPATAINESLLTPLSSVTFVEKTTGATITYQYIIPETTSNISITFKAANNLGYDQTETENISVKERITRPVKTYSSVTLGAQSNTTKGGYYSLTNNSVMYLPIAQNTPENVDLIYFYGTTNEATLCAPNDSTVNGGRGNLPLAIDLTKQNTTKFSPTTLTTTDFDAMEDDTNISTISTITETKINHLAVNQVIAFETILGKKGLIKITAINGTGTGTIVFDVKIQTDK